jgi:hypothetical protein
MSSNEHQCFTRKGTLSNLFTVSVQGVVNGSFAELIILELACAQAILERKQYIYALKSLELILLKTDRKVNFK